MASATDIVTFIGVPLAVLGVLPILYTVINSLFTLRRISQKLKANGFSSAKARAPILSGIGEVSLPRYSITPLEREDPKYWNLNPKPSNLKGGTWTFFNWNCLVTGERLYRLQYSDDLKTPQADVDFEELLSFLLDRGAVPDVKGLRMLRVSGLWTPTGTSLMLSADTTQSALRVSPPDDSDGILSLALQWQPEWDNRDPQFLPPGWMRLQILGPHESWKTEKTPLEDQRLPSGRSENETERKASQDEQPPQLKPTSLRLRLGHSGPAATISNAIWEHNNETLPTKPSPSHLLASPASLWLPTTALALGLHKSLPFYNHHLDPLITNLATRETIPCGVMVTLGLIPEEDAPPWETKYDPYAHTRHFHLDFLAQRRAIGLENSMPPAQAQKAR